MNTKLFKTNLVVVFLVLLTISCNGLNPTPTIVPPTAVVIQPTPTESKSDLESWILKRALIWINEKVQYGSFDNNSSNDYYKNTIYRADCSGYISFAWFLPEDVSTDKFISKGYASVLNDISDLQPGDILNNNRGGEDGHAVIFVRWSPDGGNKFIAYEENADPNGDGDYTDGKAIQSTLTLVPVPGGGYTIDIFEKFTNAKGPYQAQRLVLEKSGLISESSNVLGVTATREVTGPSSEGWIAFLNENNIWLIHPDGNNLTQITQNGDDNPRVVQFKWSPDGKTLAYSLSSQGGGAIMLYDVETSTTRMLINDDIGGGFDWSLTSQQIIYDTPIQANASYGLRNKGIWRINLDSGVRKQIVKPSKEIPALIDPQWSTDGSYIIFTSPCTNCPGVDGVASYETGKSILLSIDYGECEWAPSDLRIACMQAPTDYSLPDEQPSKVTILDSNGSILQELPLEKSTYDNYWFVWSPDGKTLAISYIPDQKSEMSLLSLDTGASQTLTSGEPLDWSNDGNWILTWDAEASWGPDAPRHISIVNANSGDSYILSEGMEAIWQP